MTRQSIIILILAFLVLGSIGAYSGVAPKSILDAVRKNTAEPDAGDVRRIQAGRADVARPSYEVLQQTKSTGPDGQRNLYFYTPEQARQMGLKRYTSGPCKGYYQGEEWWCK